MRDQFHPSPGIPSMIQYQHYLYTSSKFNVVKKYTKTNKTKLPFTLRRRVTLGIIVPTRRAQHETRTSVPHKRSAKQNYKYTSRNALVLLKPYPRSDSNEERQC